MKRMPALAERIAPIARHVRATAQHIPAPIQRGLRDAAPRIKAGLQLLAAGARRLIAAFRHPAVGARRLYWLAAALFAAALLGSAPARLASWFLPTDEVRAQAWRGTLWRGAAADVAAAVPGGWLQLGEVEWRLSPLSLLWLSPRVRLQADWGAQRLNMDAARGPGGWRVRSIEARADAALLKHWLPVRLGGTLHLSARDVRLRGAIPHRGEGRLEWRGGWWDGVAGHEALGDYRVAFAVPGPGHVAGEISTLAGPVVAEGSLAIDGRAYSVDARLSSEQGFGAELRSALQLMAAPAEGGFHLKFQSDW